MKLIYDAVKGAQPDRTYIPGFLSPYKIGSNYPQSKTHLRTSLIEIRRDVSGQSTACIHFTHDITQIVKKWVADTMNKGDKQQDEWAVMDITGI